jgi:hypothetical protein
MGRAILNSAYIVRVRPIAGRLPDPGMLFTRSAPASCALAATRWR